MQITGIRATPVNIPFFAPYVYSLGSTASLTKTIVEVETDEGIAGIGECADGDASATVALLRDRLVGLDPLDLNECERRCVPDISFNLWESLAVLRRAFGGIEMALWDLRGRTEQQPLYKLLGGAVRSQIPFTEYFAYRLAADGHGGESTPLDLARYCARMIEEHDSPFFEGKLGTTSLREEIEKVREIRSAIGDDRQLRLDTNGGWSVSTAREALKHLEPYNVRNFEDPVDTFEEMARLRNHTAASFSTHNPDLRRAVALGGVPDFFVVNLVELGGIRRTIEFAQAARMFGLGFWFHSGETGVASAAYLHVSAAVETIREPSQSLFRWMADDVIEEGPFSPRAGFVPVPQGPGLGVTLDRKALARCHQRFLDEGVFPSGDPSRPERVAGSFGSLVRA